MYGIPGIDDGNAQLGAQNNVVHGSVMFLANGNFTVPDGVWAIWLTGIGGGGGGNAIVSTGMGGGGSGGRALKIPFKVVPGMTFTVVIAASTTGAGNSTSFGSLLTLTGGSLSTTGAGGTGGSGGNIGGVDGGSGTGASSTGGDVIGGAGGLGGAGGPLNTTGSNAAANSGGGGGGSGGGVSGSFGGSGHLLVEW